MKVTLDCEWDKNSSTLFIKAPAEIAENCKRISVHQGNTTFSKLFSDCGAAFGMCECPYDKDTDN